MNCTQVQFNPEAPSLFHIASADFERPQRRVEELVHVSHLKDYVKYNAFLWRHRKLAHTGGA